MYLKELSLQGFKTFAKATTLRFPDPKESKHAITAVVGPNGSGKSNIADAVRWVLGEQSMKLLRGRAAEDVIFSGSDGKTRSGFAEVTLTFGDVAGIEGIEFSELTVSRRLYRDGESSYEVNGQSARLIDIQMILAQANVGQKSYSVVGQGQVDHILAASPEERKSFFDDATGVKPLQLKRHQSLLKIHRTEENLTQAELLIQELTPRLTTLRRLTKRLGEREEAEAELRRVSVSFYGSLWYTHSSELSHEREMLKTIAVELQTEREILSAERLKFENLEKEEKKENQSTPELTILQRRYDELQEKREAVRESLFELKKNAEVSAIQQTSWTPLAFPKILEAVEKLFKRLLTIKNGFKSGTLVEKDVNDVLEESENLLERLKKPTPETKKIDPAVLQKQKELEEEDARIIAELTTVRQTMHTTADTVNAEKKTFIALQHRLLAAQEKVHAEEEKANAHKVEEARLEARLEALGKEMKDVLPKDVIEEVHTVKEKANIDELHPRLLSIRQKLEQIGGIDQETVKEYEETRTRHEFLENQIADLVSALDDTKKLVKELDGDIQKQSSVAFREIQKHFEHYFKILFQGGSADIREVMASEIEEEEEGGEYGREEREDRIIGIDISATPPGKRLKSTNLLSGGERALTSIALLCAVMATNPSPFVVLDEVDAALDEANTWRFAKIVEELRPKTQFILITHNRATMHTADVLYGISMQNDGVSRVLSVKLEDVAHKNTARR